MIKMTKVSIPNKTGKLKKRGKVSINLLLMILIKSEEKELVEGGVGIRQLLRWKYKVSCGAQSISLAGAGKNSKER